MTVTTDLVTQNSTAEGSGTFSCSDVEADKTFFFLLLFKSVRCFDMEVDVCLTSDSSIK